MGYLEPIRRKKFRVHSIAVELSGRGSDRIAQDFDFYTDRPRSGEPERYSLTLELVPRPPREEDLPAQAPSRLVSDHAVYRKGNRVYHEYDDGLLVVERAGNASFAQIFSSDLALAHELGSLHLQNEIGRFLDEEGLHRVRALGIGLPNGKAALLLLPRGSGRDRLFAELAASGQCVLLSDQSPLLDRFGRVHAFPFPLAQRSGALPAASLPRPGEIFHPGFLIVAKRFGRQLRPSLRALSRWRGAGPILRDLVAAPVLPRLAEQALAEGLRGLPRLAPSAASRLAAASAFLARGRALQLQLARDPVQNARFLIEELVEKRPRF